MKILMHIVCKYRPTVFIISSFLGGHVTALYFMYSVLLNIKVTFEIDSIQQHEHIEYDFP